MPANVSVIGTASPRLGFPGVTSKVPAYLKVIGKVTSAAAGACLVQHTETPPRA